MQESLRGNHKTPLATRVAAVPRADIARPLGGRGGCAYPSKHAGLETRGNQRSQLPALRDEFLPPGAPQYQRLLDFAPTQSGDDRLYAAFGSAPSFPARM